MSKEPRSKTSIPLSKALEILMRQEPPPMTDTPTPELSAVQVALRCRVTDNPCGTDTWMVGHPCECNSCQVWLAARPSATDALVEALREIEKFTSKANGGLNGVLNFICKKALAAHTTSSTGAGWQPIETAPRDGSDVLLWWGRRSIGSWFERSVTYDHPCWIVDGGYEKQPTLWQPLPAAPADQGSVGPEWRDIISAPRTGELIKLGWWAADQWVSTHGRYVRLHNCWADEENFRLEPQKWAPADQGSAG